jgi:hypothetical protein
MAKLSNGVKTGAKYAGAGAAVTLFGTIGAIGGIALKDTVDTATKPARRKFGGVVTVKENHGLFTTNTKYYKATGEKVKDVKKAEKLKMKNKKK